MYSILYTEIVVRYIEECHVHIHYRRMVDASDSWTWVGKWSSTLCLSSTTNLELSRIFDSHESLTYVRDWIREAKCGSDLDLPLVLLVFRLLVALFPVRLIGRDPSSSFHPSNRNYKGQLVLAHSPIFGSRLSFSVYIKIMVHLHIKCFTTYQ